MSTVIMGKFHFKSIECYQALLGAHAIAPYDISVEEREKHERDTRIKRDMQPSCIEKAQNYLGQWEWAWTGGMKHLKPRIVEREIQKGEKVNNPWML
jgi:hypothetical protein